MTYNYKGRVLTFDNKLIKDYEEYVSYAPISDIDIENVTILMQHTGTDLSALTDEELSIAISASFQDEVQLMTEPA